MTTMLLLSMVLGATLLKTSDWTAKPGWTVRPSEIAVNASADNRLVGPSAPESYRWRVKLTFREGRSAGILFGASADGQKGYVARLDSRLGQLILGTLGPWPDEKPIATFPWEPIDGSTATLRVEVGKGTARVFVEERGKYPLLEARHLSLAGDHVGLYGLDADARFRVGEVESFDASNIVSHVPKVLEFKHIFDQSVGEAKPWYINDHCIIKGKDGWHLYGITHQQPADPMHERDFAHATSADLLADPWKKQPFALTYDPKLGEDHLWAPHVIQKGDTYYMFYCAGSQVNNYHYQINLATSKDLTHWTRYKNNPVFQDFFDARDPMVLLIDGTYHLYYTANLDRGTSNHVVNVRTSKDLLHWSPARVALIHPEKGTWGGPTESPFVVHYGDHFYLFVGPDGDYRATKVYRSPNPYGWSYSDQVYGFPSHAAEIVEDGGKYYATNAGWDLNGVFIAPMIWEPDASR